MLGAQLANALHERHAGAHEVHVAGDRLDHHAGDLVALGGKRLFDLGNVVVFQHQGVLHHFRRHARTGGVAEGGQAGAGLHQQCICMTVIAALELDQLAATGVAARQADGAHAGFGARTHQANLFGAGRQLEDLLGQLDLALGRRPKREPVQRGLLHGLQHLRVAVPQDHRAPGADVIDVAGALGIPHVGALGAGDETGRATHGAKRAHG